MRLIVLSEKKAQEEGYCRRDGNHHSISFSNIQKESIEAYLLEKLSKAIRVPVSYWFDETNIANQSIANGDGSAASIYGNATAGALADKDKEIDHLKELLKEKERTIQILMKQE